MLLLILATARPGTSRARVERRLKRSYPEGDQPIIEYWLQSSDPDLVLAVETGDLESIMASTVAWDEFFQFKVVPAVTAKRGLKMAKR